MPGNLGRTGLLEITSDPEDIEPFLEDMERILETSDLGKMAAFHLRCAVVEVINNCIQHAYQNKPGLPIEVSWSINTEHVRVGVSDRGPPFSVSPAVDVSTPNDGSGRGLEIIFAWVDRLEFEYKDGWNTCWLDKKTRNT